MMLDSEQASLKAEAKERVHKLVEDFVEVIKKGMKDRYNEERVKITFVLPLLEALGWNPRTDEILPEQTTLTGRADFALKLGGRTKIYVEMKSFMKNLDGHETVKGKPRNYSDQAIQYAWGMKADWAALTNFEETRLYDSHVRKAQDGMVWKKPIKYTDYVSRFDELWLLSKYSIISGALDAYKARAGRPPVDKAFLNDLMNCRQILVDNIKKNNTSLSSDQIGDCVQRILDRLIFIKNCEDRLIIPAESLWKRYKAWQETAIDKEIVVFMMDLRNFFRYFDKVFNGKLFEKHLCEELDIANEVFEEIINTLYGDGNHLGYNFNVIPIDVLGQAYELYIGSIIKEKEGKSTGLEIVKSATKRKDFGIYYTPEPIVNYIVRKTLGKALEKCKTPEDVAKIKVLDPACGSGSFLIKAFDVLKGWYDRYNNANRVSDATGTLDAHLLLIPNAEERILTQNLYGVDLDRQAVEITILNLSLRAVRTKEKLPYMADHIRCGNSLIDDETVVGDKAFNWNEEFKEIMDSGGFDVIIGNPPYVRVQQLGYTAIDFFKSHYEVAHERIDISLMFFELASKLANKFGRIGFISTTQFLTAEYGRNLRKLLLTKRIEEFVDFGSLPIFEDAITYSAIIVFSNDSPATFNYYKISKLNNYLMDNLVLALEEDVEGVTKLQVDSSSLGEDIWNFSGQEKQEIVLQIRNNKNTLLLGVFANPSTGLFTGSDEVLLLDESTITRERIEQGILIKTLRGRNIEPWLIRGPYDFSIYPYELKDNKTNLLSVEEFERKYPNAYSYLLKNKEKLLRRKDSRKEVAESKQWFGLIRKGRLDTFKSPKIVTPALTKHNSFAFDEEGNAFLTGGAGVFAILQTNFHPYYLLAVLNSKLVEFFLHQISTKKQGGYYSYLNTFLAQIPIVVLDEEKQKPFVQLATAINSYKGELEIKITKFLNRVEERFPNIKVSKNLASFYELDFGAFLKEIRKLRRTKLSLKDADEWEDYFEAHKTGIIELGVNISKLEKEIDSMVFDLYGLSEEQKRVVCESTSSE